MDQTQPDAEGFQSGSPQGAPKNTHIDVDVRVGTVKEGGKLTGVKVDTIQGPVTIHVTGLAADLEALRRQATTEALRKPDLPLQWFEPETVYIAGGPFLMGSDPGPDIPEYETPQHEVALAEYRIGKYPVTNRQYLVFVNQSSHPVAPETGWRLARVGQEPPPGREDHPVGGITWDDAVAYCRWLSDKTRRHYRLPSEAEWEKAARGTDGRLYPWGDESDPARCNCGEAGRRDTSVVGSYSPQGDNPYGCADMAGNVWEWTSTRWVNERPRPAFAYPYDPADGREDPTRDAPHREYRICRGGSYRDRLERTVCAARARERVDIPDATRGFRVVLDTN